MLKNVLEANGYEICSIEMSEKQATSIYFNGNLVYKKYHSKWIDKDFICKQYVRENGFKLEWFDKQQIFLLDRAKEIYKDKRYSYDTWFKSYLMMNQDKLIAWLYSEDIKIVEE